MAEIIDMNKRKAHAMKQEQPNKAQDILSMIRARTKNQTQDAHHTWNYLREVQADVLRSCMEINAIITDRRFNDEADAPFTPLTQEQKNAQVMEALADIYLTVDQMHITAQPHRDQDLKNKLKDIVDNEQKGN